MSDNFIDAYKSQASIYSDFVDEVLFTLKEESHAVGLRYADLKGRVKSPESVAEKIKRQKLTNPAKQLFDLAGVRIICLFEAEKVLFRNLVTKLFDIDWEEDKKQGRGASEMGYQSIHLGVRFGNNFSGIRYNRFRGLLCEVQITTVLLDAWASISHTLVYKSAAAIPVTIQRDINSVSSLLEIAQRIFDDSYQKRNEYISDLQNSDMGLQGLMYEPINYDSLTQLSKLLYPKLPISEFWQNRLITDLNRKKFRTIKDIKDAVDQSSGFIDFYSRLNPNSFTSSTDFLTKALGFVDDNFRDKHQFSPITLKAFRDFHFKHNN